MEKSKEKKSKRMLERRESNHKPQTIGIAAVTPNPLHHEQDSIFLTE